MKKFTFALQPVLNLREQEEKTARTELGKRTAECDRIRRQMDEHINLLGRFAEDGNREIDWQAYQEASDFIRTQNRRLTDELGKAEERRREALDVYRQALNRKKVFEKLKERRKEEYIRSQKEKENKVLDDLFSSRETYKRSLKK